MVRRVRHRASRRVRDPVAAGGIGAAGAATPPPTAPASAPAASPPAPVAPVLPPEVTTPVERLAKSIETAEKSIQQLKELESELQRLRTDIEGIIYKSTSTAEALRPQLAEVRSQIERLGAPPKDQPETPTIAAERARLNALAGALDGAIRTTELAWVRAKQMIDRITVMRYQIFSRNLFERRTSPLLPSVWLEVADRFPTIVGRIRYYGAIWLEQAAQATEPLCWPCWSPRFDRRALDQRCRHQLDRQATRSVRRHPDLLRSHHLGGGRGSGADAGADGRCRDPLCRNGQSRHVLLALGAHRRDGAPGCADLCCGLCPRQRRARAAPAAVAAHPGRRRHGRLHPVLRQGHPRSLHHRHGARGVRTRHLRAADHDGGAGLHHERSDRRPAARAPAQAFCPADRSAAGREPSRSPRSRWRQPVRAPVRSSCPSWCSPSPSSRARQSATWRSVAISPSRSC